MAKTATIVMPSCLAIADFTHTEYINILHTILFASYLGG